MLNLSVHPNSIYKIGIIAADFKGRKPPQPAGLPV
jgi:hypothetical protein